MSNSKHKHLAELKQLSDKVVQLEAESLDYMCPLLANMCTGLDTLHRDTTECYDTIGKLADDFMLDEDFRDFNKDIYYHTLCVDKNFEEEKNRLIRDNDLGFLNYYDRLNKGSYRKSFKVFGKQEDQFDIEDSLGFFGRLCV